MKLGTRFCILLVIAAGAHAQDAGTASRPDPREIPVPRIQTAMGALPGVKELPLRREMPDVMLMSDGRMVKTRRQWQERREEMKRILAYYAVGQMPPPPGNVTGKEVNSEIVLDGRVKYRLVHLTFGPDRRLSLNIGVFTPVEGGPFPAIILQGGTPPGASPLPRLPQGPNQGRGEDVLLLVGPGTAAGASPLTSRAPWRASQCASDGQPIRRCVPSWLCAGGLQSQRLCRGHHSAQPRRELGIPQHPLLSCLPWLRLGRARRLGVGRLAGCRLPGDGSRHRQEQTHHHGRFEKWKVRHGRGGV